MEETGSGVRAGGISDAETSSDCKLSALSFRYPFRKYQKMMLSQVDARPGLRKFHIVAPPGSGKTIVGLELIRRFDCPAVVFAPTTTIQEQWKDKVGMFLEDTSLVSSITSLDPHKNALINVFTYQLISTPGEAQEFGRQMAVKRWIDDLLVEGQAEDEKAASERLASLKANNPDEYGREIRKRYLRVKRDLLRREDIDIASFLHPNARKLIDDLVAHGVKVVVLDECHHLLDYWAIVIRYLIRKIENPVIIGLTATLPSLEDEDEYENYTSLLGDVDFEVPTPAVVKEGDLAPYRDLVYFVAPTDQEFKYLRNIQAAFEEALAKTTKDPSFRDWVIQQVTVRPTADGGRETFEQYLNSHPILSIAQLRYLNSIDIELPPELPLPLEADDDLSLEDWAVMLERYALDYLKVSQDAKDHDKLAELRRAIRPFGLSLTERGMRQTRSAGDLILALSQSKDKAVVNILTTENEAMGPKLRAIVVTDFERMTTLSEDLKGVLEKDAGSAWRVFRSIVSDPESGKLDPVLVTGKTVLADADLGDRLIRIFNDYLKSQKYNASCEYKETPFKGILEVEGSGPDWTPRAYVRMVTEAFEKGYTRCIVGTRGIFGEGWDSLSLNTLIDLTAATTSTSVQQLRGRSIRKDPTWPRKVAHDWDVVCVAPEFKKGDTDLRRFQARHANYWGITTVSNWLQRKWDSTMSPVPVASVEDKINLGKPVDMQPDLRSRVVKGVAHVDVGLAYELKTEDFHKIQFIRYNDRMLNYVKDRDRTYNQWGVGDQYSNFTYSSSRIEVKDMKIRTVYTVNETLKKMLRKFWASFFCALGFILYFYSQIVPDIALIGSLPMIVLVVGLLIVIALAVAFMLNVRAAYRIAHKFLLEQPPDAILMDIGRALLAALQDAQLVSPSLREEFVRVVEQPDDSYEVCLDYASPEDSARFVQAYHDIFEPVRRQRYLILRNDSRLPNLAFSPIWLALRAWYRRKWGYKPAYHPVPKILAATKERAESFAFYWRKYVGGGKLVFTHTEKGRKILFKARAQARPKVRDLAFEVWR